MLYTDEDVIYNRRKDWEYGNKSVNYGEGEYAGDDDGDGFHEVHVNTMEGGRSLLLSRLRPHWGISQEKLPLYLGFFEFIHNARKRGKVFCFIPCFKDPETQHEPTFLGILSRIQVPSSVLSRYEFD